MKKEIIVYSISDSLGGTSQRLLSAVSAQYPDLTFNNSYRFPFIDKENSSRWRSFCILTIHIDDFC